MILVRYENWAVPGLYHPGSMDMNLPVSRAFVHHTVTPTPLNPEGAVALMRGIDKYHRQSRGWQGIGYSFVVADDGTVYEGRGQKVGGHTQNNNSRAFGIAFLGTFTNHVPPPAAILAAADLMRHLMNTGALTYDFELLPHRAVAATQCPGDALANALPNLRALVSRKDVPVPPMPAPVPPVDPNAPPVHTSNAAPVGIAATGPDGYLILTADGGVFAFGSARYLGRVAPPAEGWA